MSLFYNQDSVTRFKKRKARFSFSEVHVLLDEVRKNRMVVVGTCLCIGTFSTQIRLGPANSFHEQNIQECPECLEVTISFVS